MGCNAALTLDPLQLPYSYSLSYGMHFAVTIKLSSDLMCCIWRNAVSCSHPGWTVLYDTYDSHMSYEKHITDEVCCFVVSSDIATLSGARRSATLHRGIPAHHAMLACHERFVVLPCVTQVITVG